MLDNVLFKDDTLLLYKNNNYESLIRLAKIAGEQVETSFNVNTLKLNNDKFEQLKITTNTFLQEYNNMV